VRFYGYTRGNYWLFFLGFPKIKINLEKSFSRRFTPIDADSPMLLFKNEIKGHGDVPIFHLDISMDEMGVKAKTEILHLTQWVKDVLSFFGFNLRKSAPICGPTDFFRIKGGACGQDHRNPQH